MSWPRHLSAVQLFVEQVARSPAACALVCGERTLTYRELDQAANRLARELTGRGLAPGTRIAILLDRSPEMVTALLAVLKAGSAYVPLDPAYPPERLAHVLGNARPAAIISRTALLGLLPVGNVPVVALDVAASSIDRQDDGPLPIATAPEDLAYVIYTSGSTGVPKGVQIPQRAMVNLLWAMRSQPGIAAGDTLLAVTTIAFDIAVLEIFLPLIAGARIVIAREQETSDGAALRRLVQEHAVTLLQATPMTWQLLLEAGWESTPGLRMLCGGEALSRSLAEKLLRGGGELWNMYGPTETTVWSSVLRVASGDGPVLLGPPIANTQFHVLDEGGARVAPGDAGELYIGGEGVGLGYFAAPAQTAERFLPDPFSTAAGARLYRTGDIVRGTEAGRGGQLAYLGRADHQVKLRGFRIELGEIEATLLRHPDIAQAVAVVGPSRLGEAELRAYVVLRKAWPPRIPDDAVADLKVDLWRCLPAYMHPAAIVPLLRLPQTPNGKVDRNALSAPAPASGEEPASRTEPVTQREGTEQRLAAIWRTLLGTNVVGRESGFFALGGHSLLVARLLVRIEAEFGVRVGLGALFAAATLGAQVDLILQQGGTVPAVRQAVQLQGKGSRTPLFAINGTGSHYYRLATLLEAAQPLTVLQLFDPAVPGTVLPGSLEDIAAGYVQVIRTLQPQGPYQLLGWCVGGVLAFEVARQFSRAGEQIGFVGLIDAWAPGHLESTPGLRGALARRSFRLQLIGADWQRYRAGQQSLGTFLRKRVFVQRWLALSGSNPPVPVPVAATPAHTGIADYDAWLNAYLDAASARYAPQPFAVKLTLLRSSREPRGWPLDRFMGWRSLAPAGIDTAVLEGDHFTVFQDRGLSQMATRITAALSTRGNDAGRDQA